MYKTLPFVAALFATIDGVSLSVSCTHTAKAYSEDNKTKLTSSISD